MKRTLIVIVIAFGVLLSGCGGPGDAPENETGEPVDEEPGDGADDGGAGGDGGGEDGENASVTVSTAATASTPSTISSR